MVWDRDVRNLLGGAIFYWLEIRRHLLVYCHDLGGSLLSSSPRTIPVSRASKLLLFLVEGLITPL